MVQEDRPGDTPAHDRPLRVCVVGAGTRFLSGISYYTLRLANALASSQDVSVILMRQLLPARFYPGRERIGKSLTTLKYAPNVPVYDGVDWFWLPSMLRAVTFLIRSRPEVLVFQWWTGTVLHSYLLLALVGRLLGAKVVVEFHEVLATEEARMRWAGTYVRLLVPLLVRLSSGIVIHSEFDRPALNQRYSVGTRPVAIIPHGPYDHHQADTTTVVQREAPPDCCNILCFGVIRPFKGVEDLIAAFNSIPAGEIDGFWLSVVGETWEGWTLPTEMIAQSPYRDRITFVNRYVRDEEVSAFFAGADVVALPYHRSSASGPVHVAMSHGLPLVVTRVGGLPEAVHGYAGAILVPPADPPALLAALRQATTLRGQSFTDPQSWERTAARFQQLFARLRAGSRTTAGPDHGSQRIGQGPADAD